MAVEEKAAATKDLWTEVLEAYQNGKLDELTGKQHGAEEVKQDKEDASWEPNVIFVGAKESGKSSLLNAYIMKDKADVPKPTGSLDYKYIRSSSGGGDKDVSHFWELGGGRALVSQIDIALSPKRLESAFVVLVLDLSKPHSVLPDLMYWLGVLRARASVCLAKLAEQNKDPKYGDRIRQAAVSRFGPSHEDLAGGNIEELLPVPVLVVASKWDAFMSKDPELLKIMAATLRAVCHSHGASLMYTSNADKATIAAFRSRISRHVSNKEPAMPLQTDRTKPLSVLAGADSYKDIGLPSGVPLKKSPADTWAFAYSRTFAAPDGEEAVDADVPAVNLAAEPVVDQALALKSDDLKRITRKMELARKMLEAENSGAFS